VGRRKRMGSIGRYIFRTTFGAFLLVLISLTAAIWFNPGVRERRSDDRPGPDHPGIPRNHQSDRPATGYRDRAGRARVAAAHILHKLATDSEIIVMNGAGMRRGAC